MYQYVTIATFTLLSVLNVLADPGRYEMCAFLCEKIPPIDESYIQIIETTAPALNNEDLELLVWNVYKGQKNDWNADFTSLAESADEATGLPRGIEATRLARYNRHHLNAPRPRSVAAGVCRQ